MLDQKLILISSVFIFLEIFIYLLFNWLKKDFKWLVNKKDLNPQFEKKKYNNFMKNSYDDFLGWDRKSLTKGFEISDTKTFFEIDKVGSRKTTKHSKSTIAVYGDSFAFCRYVNDNETWQYHLSNKIKNKILNFGVGNFGLDQAFLKYIKKEKKISSQEIIFCVVPETIARVFSYWKHYREFNNIFAIKPILNFKKKKLNIVRIPKLRTDTVSKNYIKFNQKFINKTKKEDIFYKYTFKKKLFKFPYTISFVKKLNQNLNIFYLLIVGKLMSIVNKSSFHRFHDQAFSKILEENIKESHGFYEEIYFKKNFRKLLNFIDLYFKKKKIKYKILIVPQYYDLKLKNHNHKYTNFFKSLDNKNIIDLTDKFKKNKNWKKFYFNESYGGHLNVIGNKYLANLLFREKLF